VDGNPNQEGMQPDGYAGQKVLKALRGPILLN
jgi:hypothetical protein